MEKKIPDLKIRISYGLVFMILFLTEVLIAIFVHDQFIRPYAGDILVTVLLCCFMRIGFPRRPKNLALWVFLFSVVVELSQLMKLSEILGLKGTVLGVILGSTFDWVDIICYFIGCLAFFVVESIYRRK